MEAVEWNGTCECKCMEVFEQYLWALSCAPPVPDKQGSGGSMNDADLVPFTPSSPAAPVWSVTNCSSIFLVMPWAPALTSQPPVSHLKCVEKMYMSKTINYGELFLQYSTKLVLLRSEALMFPWPCVSCNTVWANPDLSPSLDLPLLILFLAPVTPPCCHPILLLPI